MGYNLYSTFDIDQHKATFIDYLEVIITNDGVIHYAVPSHQQYVSNIIKKEHLLNEEEFCAVMPMTAFHEFLLAYSGAVMVWSHGYTGIPNKKQLLQLQLLHNEGLLAESVGVNHLAKKNYTYRRFIHHRLIVEPGIVKLPIHKRYLLASDIRELRKEALIHI